MKNNYYKEKEIKHNKTNEENFFKYYFENDAKKNNLDIIYYYDPLNISSINQTLNLDYLKRIFKNDNFKQKFIDCMENEFVP